MFYLHGSGDISNNNNLNRFFKQRNKDSLVQRDAMNAAVSHLIIFPLFKLEGRCAVVHKDQEPRDHSHSQVWNFQAFREGKRAYGWRSL